MKQADTRDESADDNSAQFNILLICIDDLRADRLSLFGNDRATCPNLVRRCADATLFQNCHSPVGWTLPACASIITGLQPEDHGLVHHQHRFRALKLGHHLGSDYHRVALTNNGNLVPDHIDQSVLNRLGHERKPDKWRRFGWDSGFDDYHWWSREHETAPFEQAANFLRQSGERPSHPWLLFLHANIVHDYHLGRPCYLDAPWAGAAIDPALHEVEDGPQLWRDLPAGISRETAREHLLKKYDAGILAMDRLLETVLAEVDFETTLVVFSSDHGEGFEPELGRVHHCGRLHNDLTHVPLLLWLPSRLRQEVQPPAEEFRACSTLDIVPTLLLLNGQACPDLPGEYLFDPPNHRELQGCDLGYLFWADGLERDSYDDCDIEIRSRALYPLKTIQVRRGRERREHAYHLAYDPGERHDLTAQPAAPLAPVTFVVVVNDYDELRWNLLASPVAVDDRHQWLLIDNRNNAAADGIASLYDGGLDQADNDIVFFVHQDVYFPLGWEARVATALQVLAETDPNWGVLGAVGMGSAADGQSAVRGHWSDPNGYHCHGPLPCRVRTLDELWLGIHKDRGPTFDPALPGFHCYGVDLCLSAEAMGMSNYAVDAFVWHKYRDRQGNLVARPRDSGKLCARWSDGFMAEFRPSADYVAHKWRHAKPFDSTCWQWR